MLKHLKRKQAEPIRIPEADSEAITCGACGHLREPEANCPDWQCPCCGKAYAKVNAGDEAERFSRQELRRLNQQYLERKKKAEKALLSREETEHPAFSGIWLGVATYATGLGSTCVAIASNPIVQGVGIAIVLGSIAWGLSSFFQ